MTHIHHLQMRQAEQDPAAKKWKALCDAAASEELQIAIETKASEAEVALQEWERLWARDEYYIVDPEILWLEEHWDAYYEHTEWEHETDLLWQADWIRASPNYMYPSPPSTLGTPLCDAAAHEELQLEEEAQASEAEAAFREWERLWAAEHDEEMMWFNKLCDS